MRKRQYSCLEGPQSDLSGIPLPVVHNIVSTAQITSSLPCLDLEKIRQLLPFSFYDRSRFAAITIRLSNPECTTLLFSSGKLVVTGGRTWYEGVYSGLYVAKLLKDCIPSERFSLSQCTIQNMVAHVELPLGPSGGLDIQAMYARLGLNCTYQKRMFPGLIYRPESSPVVLLCFYSGKIVITGGKTLSDIYEGWTRLWPVVRTFMRPSDDAMVGQGLALVRDGGADKPRGAAKGLVNSRRGGECGVDVLGLGDVAVLEGLGDDLGAEGPAKVARTALAAAAAVP